MTANTILNFSSFKSIIIRAFGGPALPLALMINGSLFYFAIFHIIGTKPNYYLTAGYYCSLIGWILGTSIKRGWQLPFKFHSIDLTFFLFIGYVFVSLFLHGLEGQEKQIIYLFVFVLSPYICGRLICSGDVAPFLAAIFLIGNVGLIVAAIDTIVEFNEVMSWVRPFFFGFNHTTLLVGFLLSSVILLSVFFFMLFEKQLFGFQPTIVFWAILTVSIGSLIFIKCRGVLIAIFLISIGGCVTLYWISWKRRVIVALGLIGLIVIFYLIIPSSFKFMSQAKESISSNLMICQAKESIFSNLMIYPEDQSLETLGIFSDSVAMRFLLWNEAIRIFLKNPILGIGAGRFGDHSIIKNVFPHSTILQTLAELGILGSVLFFIYVAQIFFNMVFMFCYGRYEYLIQKKSLLIFSLWIFYFIIDQIYGDYLRNIAFSILSGISVSMIVYVKNNQVILDDV